MMMYSKGDTLKFTNGSIALVLNDGLSGRDFLDYYYEHDIIELFKSHEELLPRRYLTIGYIRDHVWYEVLMGDIKGWYGVCSRYEGQ